MRSSLTLLNAKLNSILTATAFMFSLSYSLSHSLTLSRLLCHSLTLSLSTLHAVVSLAQVALYRAYRPGSAWAKEPFEVPLSILMEVPSLSDLQNAHGEGKVLVVTTGRCVHGHDHPPPPPCTKTHYIPTRYHHRRFRYGPPPTTTHQGSALTNNNNNNIHHPPHSNTILTLVTRRRCSTAPCHCRPPPRGHRGMREDPLKWAAGAA